MPDNQHPELEDLDTVHVYRDSKGEIRWRRSAHGNHEPLGHAGEGFRSEDAALENLLRVNRAPFLLTTGDDVRVDAETIVVTEEP